MKKLKKIVVLCLAVIMLFTACGKKGEEVTKELSITQMQTICELATLKCYYHNVAKLTKEKEVLWWDTSAELWIEYSGIVKLGVDIANLDMQVDGDQVTITMPKAEVLSCQVKPSRMIKPGEVIQVKKPPVTYSFKVLQAIEKRIGAKLVPEILENVTTPEQYELLEMSRISGFVDRARGTGRPTKKDRRSMEEFITPEYFGDDDFDFEFDFEEQE